MASAELPSGAAQVVGKVAGLFGERATVLDGKDTSFAFGQALARLQKRERLADKVRQVLASGKAGRQLTEILENWLKARNATDLSSVLAFSDQWLVREAAFDKDIRAVHEQQSLLPKPSLWIVVNDGMGPSGGAASAEITAIHNILAAEEDVNVLVLVADPALASAAGGEGARLRRDVGLYALNYGTSYVASTSPLADPAQYERALKEADAFHGPSVVLAYVPTDAQVAAAGEGASPVSVATEAVNSGRWPLYRWDPAADARGEETAFAVDSAKLRDDIKAFVDGNNHLTLLSRAQPSLAPELTSSVEGTVGALAAAAEAKLKASFDKLMGAFTPPPLVVLFGSDGGNAEGLAKRLGTEAKSRYGFTDVTVKAMDAVTSLGDLGTASTPVAVFVVSTAGQGDMPTNARGFWKALQGAVAAEQKPLAALKYAVFGLGDSNYWPKKEQRVFFNKASVDLDAALAAAGAAPLVERGIGDDQDVGGFSAGWKRWTPALWASLGVAVPAPKEEDGAGKVRGAEDVKTTSKYLRGTIAQGLTDATTGALTYEDTLLT